MLNKACSLSLSSHVLQPPDHFSGPPMNLLLFINIFYTLGVQNRMNYFMCGLKCAEPRGIIPSFDLSAAFLLKQPRMCWIFCCLACGWLVSSCCLPFFQPVQDGIASLPSNLLTLPLNLMPSTNEMRSLKH